ncbi:MAG: bacillithiol system redox-active protein YtxJ, partial [Winogradskyella sp.]|nr:bacillithiol system redox-active protein YtxJ [Winogradskyella sp.]
MGLFDKIFKTEKKEEKVLPWIPLNAIPQLNYIAEKSKTKTQVIFK